MMKIIINGTETETLYRTAMQLHNALFSDTDVIVLNGYQISDDAELNENDQIYFGKKNVFPNMKELRMIMSARDSPFVHEKLKGATVGIAGLGGLGSNIAAMLARSGIGHLVIADFDTVEPTNLNRQNYYVNNIGMKKTDSTEEILFQINPFIEITKYFTKIDENNVFDIFGKCDVVCEAFDSPFAKAMLINALLEKCPKIMIISGSGMGGYEDSNLIKTKMRIKRLYVCGDEINEAAKGMGLMAPRVSICAGHMANAVIRILIGSMR